MFMDIIESFVAKKARQKNRLWLCGVDCCGRHRVGFVIWRGLKINERVVTAFVE